ncbi:MAG: lmo0937 family membrane protein [Luteitalea sp.]|nr:lmo0937 family membrane protein [Luteitalea sp.]
MLWTILLILLFLWLAGLVTSYTLGGFIHVLLVIALILIILNLIQGRRPVV